MRCLQVLLVLGLAATSFAQSRPIDTVNSTLTIHAYKSGVFSFAGHDHVIRAPITSGAIDESRRMIEFTVNVRNMQVLDPSESEKNKAEIHETMLGSRLLEAEKYPEIRFRSSEIRQVTPNTFEVHGDLVLHGRTRPLTLRVAKEGNRYTGQTKIKQTDYGLTPVAVAGGTVKVKNEVMIEFSVQQ